MPNISDIEFEFRQWLAQLNISPAPSENLILDSKKHYYTVDGDKRGKKSAEYCIYIDNRPAGYVKDYKRDIYSVFIYKSKEIDKAELEQLRSEANRKRERRNKEHKERQAYAIKLAKFQWKNSTPPDQKTLDGYPKRKNIAGLHGARQMGNDIIIPLFNSLFRVVSTQRISSDGKKRLLKGAPKRSFFSVVPLPDGVAKPCLGGKKVFICEGWATACTIYEATGCDVIVAIDAYNLLPVAKQIRDMLPGTEIVIAPDVDPKAGNTGITQAMEITEELGLPLCPPPLKAGEGSDWNDYASIYGIEETSKVIEESLEEFTKIPEVDLYIKNPKWIHMTQGEKPRPKSTIENFGQLLRSRNISARYNMVAKDILLELPGKKFSLDNHLNSAIEYIRSMCEEVGMSSANVPGYLLAIADQNRFNPVCEWIKGKPWDGKSRLPDLFNSIQVDSWFPTSLRDALIYRWMISAVAAAFSDGLFTTRGVLVLQGSQGLGKTSWFRSMVPKDRGWFGEGLTLDPADRDSVKRCVSHWISELGELEATFRQADLARLKAFITNQVDELRLPYGRSFATYPRRTVLCASVNQREILKDPTGNSRWWCIACSNINYNHRIDMQQVWAELYIKYREGEKWWLSKDEEHLLESLNWNFESPDPIHDLIASKFNWNSFNPNNDFLCEELTAAEVLKRIGIDTPSRPQCMKAGEVLRHLSGQKARRSTGGRRVYRVPKPF